jgi:hypothetical protein
MYTIKGLKTVTTTIFIPLITRKHNGMFNFECFHKPYTLIVISEKIVAVKMMVNLGA